jgi:hypothetical protein
MGAYDFTVRQHVRDPLKTPIPNTDRIVADTPDPANATIFARATA